MKSRGVLYAVFALLIGVLGMVGVTGIGLANASQTTTEATAGAIIPAAPAAADRGEGTTANLTPPCVTDRGDSPPGCTFEPVRLGCEGTSTLFLSFGSGGAQYAALSNAPCVNEIEAFGGTLFAGSVFIDGVRQDASLVPLGAIGTVDLDAAAVPAADGAPSEVNLVFEKIVDGHRTLFFASFTGTVSSAPPP